MKANYIKTSNTMKLLAALDALKNRGAEEACLAVIDGEPGLGKTTTIQWFATSKDGPKS